MQTPTLAGILFYLTASLSALIIVPGTWSVLNKYLLVTELMSTAVLTTRLTQERDIMVY